MKEQNKMVLFTVSSETSDIDLFSLLLIEEQDTPFHFSISFSVAELITETEWLNDLSYRKVSLCLCGKVDSQKLHELLNKNCASYSVDYCHYEES